MLITKRSILTIAIVMALFFSVSAQADGVKVIIENRAPDNGTWLTPVWVGFHDGSFDAFDLASVASEELERMAEDGNAEPLSDLFSMGSAGEVQGVIVTDEMLPPFEPGETAEMTFILDGSLSTSRYFSFLSMVIPSNDAFIGNDNPTAHQIYDGGGNFLGAYFTIYGTDVRDAGTEINDEIPENTAFFGQMVPNTGGDENGVIAMHPGYLPAGSGGILDDPMFASADFTEPGYEIARITIIRNDTPVSGNVSGVWDIEGSPYLLDGDVTVPTGETLVIEPGVVVFAQSWYYFAVQGNLQAIGTEQDSILFTSVPHGPGEPAWRSIHFESADEHSEMAYCIVENVHATAAAPYNQGAIHIDNSSPTIRNSSIRNNETDFGGGIFITNGSMPLIKENDIVYNASGYGGGIYSSGSAPQIMNNNISWNATARYGAFTPVASRGGGIYLTNSSDGALIEYNLISMNTVHAEGNVGSHASGGGISCWQSDATIYNNTISGNSATLYSSGNEGGGLHFYFSNSDVRNNIIDNNEGGGAYFEDEYTTPILRANDFYNNGTDFLGNVPAQLGVISTINYNGDPADIFLNIFLDPLYINAAGGDYTLQAGSPAIDAGDPTTPYDPDGTIADQGAFYYDQGSMPMVEITLTPYDPPIVVPANGGSFNYNIAVNNGEATPVNLDVWIMVQLPSGSWFGPVLGPVNLMFAGGSNLSRDRMQDVPTLAPPGTYLYEGYVGVYPNVVWHSDSFTFEKSTVGDGAVVAGWENSGAEFDQLLTEASVEAPTEFNLAGAYPNPFNPVTTIGFSLPEASKVSLSVYDINGRLVATVVDGYRNAGVHEATFDATGLASGVYLYALQAGSFTASGKMMLVK